MRPQSTGNGITNRCLQCKIDVTYPGDPEELDSIQEFVYVNIERAMATRIDAGIGRRGAALLINLK